MYIMYIHVQYMYAHVIMALALRKPCNTQSHLLQQFSVVGVHYVV